MLYHSQPHSFLQLLSRLLSLAVAEVSRWYGLFRKFANLCSKGSSAWKCCNGGTDDDDGEVWGRKCLAQGRTANCAPGRDQRASRAGQCWAALLGVVCRSGRPGNRQCLGSESGTPRFKAASELWLALGMSGLGPLHFPQTQPALLNIRDNAW